MRHRIILAASALLGLASIVAGADITACGVTIAAGDVGVLQSDLDCTTEPFGVRLLPGATLDLNGHAVHVGPQAEATVLGVATASPDPLGAGPGSFTIVGPGEISGEGQANPLGGTYACVQLNDGRAIVKSDSGIVDVHGCVYGVVGSAGVGPNGGRLTITNASLHDNVFDGVAVKKLTATSVDASSNGGQGLGALATKLVDVTANDNPHGHGVFGADTLKATNVTANGNYTGAECWRTLRVTGLTATGNMLFGAAGGKVRLVGSTVTGNGIADIVSTTVPMLVQTTCGTSIDRNSVTWGVCSDD